MLPNQDGRETQANLFAFIYADLKRSKETSDTGKPQLC